MNTRSNPRSPETAESPDEAGRALRSTAALLAGGADALAAFRQAAQDDSSVAQNTDFTDPEVRYALQFLTYAYAVPFRLVALQQELVDVFGWEGDFDAAFLARWETLSQPEQAAFSQSFREYRRMQALGRSFAQASQDVDAVNPPLDERAGRFVAAHTEGIESWQAGLTAEARTGGGGAPLPLLDSGGGAAPLPAAPGAQYHAIPALPPVETSGGALLNGIASQDSQMIASVLESLAPIDDLARVVLERLSEQEIAEAQRRFLARARWMLSLPNQQRVAVALRTIGRRRREIARAMGISEESVKTHLARADDDWEHLSEAQKSGAGGSSRSKTTRKRRQTTVGTARPA